MQKKQEFFLEKSNIFRSKSFRKEHLQQLISELLRNRNWKNKIQHQHKKCTDLFQLYGEHAERELNEICLGYKYITY